MTEQAQSNYWLDVAVREITKKFPDGEIVVSSGISPSASYHVGHFREILTADALAWGLRQGGRKVVHKHVVDNFDPLRKRYSFLPEEFEHYVGQPICLIPDPIGDCHETYAEHFYQEFEAYARQMGITNVEVIRSYEQMYKPGKMTQAFEDVLEKAGRVRTIFEEVSNRELPEDWTPVQVIGENKIFHNASISSWNKTEKTVGGVEYTSGKAKLNWRLDWPARWRVLGVMVEPFSLQEHGAAGGSYGTGKLFSKDVFGYEPPIPGVEYANIHMIGDTKKMSSSKGNLITPKQALEIMPAEILRYFVVRSKPDRTLFFDSGVGLFNLIDEYSKTKSEIEATGRSDFAEAYNFASAIREEDTISSVRFGHLVQVYQAAQADTLEVLEILRRTGYEEAIKNERQVIERELEFVKNWLAKYAPDSVKFQVQADLPKVELSDKQKDFLVELSGLIYGYNGETDGQAMHNLIYEAKEVVQIEPAEAFKAIYRIILGKDSGPKAGWFLASLDRDWLVERLNAVA